MSRPINERSIKRTIRFGRLFVDVFANLEDTETCVNSYLTYLFCIRQKSLNEFHLGSDGRWVRLEPINGNA